MQKKQYYIHVSVYKPSFVTMYIHYTHCYWQSTTFQQTTKENLMLQKLKKKTH